MMKQRQLLNEHEQDTLIQNTGDTNVVYLKIQCILVDTSYQGSVCKRVIKA